MASICTRLRVLRLYRRQNTFSNLDFLSQMVVAFPFPIRKLQTDNGSAFSFTFMLAVECRGICHRYIKPRRPDQNGRVERSHRVDAEEFWGRRTFDSFEAAAALPEGNSWSLTSLQQRLFETGGHLIRHARCFTLQLAESHLTRTVFRQILGRIERLAWHAT